ncbi:putative PHD finger and SET domain protein [Aspergillus chevalieri]|uniref:SET domain-containing protein n=1 Tax=Aspergillus chevalieri TaxID=182096 RepID=A0A7R7VQ54_ASPCH|nr:uncharacterized protein ACHE_40637A [Aspergillus chevalieri]BCR88073.1 hypothetical protein ACHE_40637A [Aspergillus chevalieri]
MTDTSSVANTHSTTEPTSVPVPLPSPALNGAGADPVVPEEEEPYTIRCVCNYDDDDGNTVFCEKCETWQHIECYYHGVDVPDIHFCEDCYPRGIDRAAAIERQRAVREQQSDGGNDRKSKRSGSKGQRKRASKDPADKVNGTSHHRSDSGGRDHPVKKSKSNHRSSNSVSSLAGIPAFQPDGRKRATASMSPTKSGPSIPLYSKEFLHLYDHDHGQADIMNSNLFVNLPLAADLASWVTEPAALARVANGRSAQDIFTWADAGLDKSRWPTLAVETVTDPSIEVDGIHPMWKTLRTQDKVAKDEIVGEITGKIGHLRDYCLDPNNRWQELRHPEPFVFFHPQLPLYIDSRHEGSTLRYVRRSCRPNVTMKTYITNEVEYHFCFVAKEDISANTEITAMWYLDPQLTEATNGLVKQESNDSAQDIAAICISNVLANYGGCACDPPSNCLLANVDRRRHAKIPDGGAKSTANGKRKKSKRKLTMSPPPPNSRADSEAMKHTDDDDAADSRSASGSARGHAGSRDLSPTHDGPLFGDSEMSARDKRKIAAAEKKFQQLEQDQQAAAHGRKKKRTSGPSTQPGPLGGASSMTGGKSVQVDTAVGRHSRSPPSAISPGTMAVGVRKVSGRSTPSVPSPLRRAPYVDAAMQTDPDEANAEGVPTISPLPSPRRPSFVPLTQRLLKRCHADWVRFEQSNGEKQTPPEHGLQSPASSSAATPGDGQPLLQSASPSVFTNQEKEDVEMKGSDSPTPYRPESSDAMEVEPSGPPSPTPVSWSNKPQMSPPWPSTAAHNARISLAPLVNGHRTDLHMSLPPPNLTSSTASPGSGTPSTMSPASTMDATSQPTPGSGVTAPSPVKKKLSLGDYLIQRRGTMNTPTAEKTQSQANAMLPPPPQKSPSQTSDNQPDGVPAQPKPDGASEEAKPDDGPVSSDITMKDVPPPDSATPHLHSVMF